MEINSLLVFPKDFSKAVRSVFAFNPTKISRTLIGQQSGFNPDSLAIPEQVHSIGVKWVEAPGKYSGIDGLITQNPLIILTLKVADCVPVYLIEPQKHIIGLVHSGWRGTANGIVSKTIKLMQKKGADIQKILVYLGPAIGICCYEVDSEVADSFDKKAKVKMENKKWKIDLHKQISSQLSDSGILVFNIQVSDICTFESHKCHSHRRDGKISGRMFAFLGLK